MKIELLHFENCPNSQPALELLQDVMRQEGVDIPIQSIAVQTLDDAEKHRFPGSPTIRIDGLDVEGEVGYPFGLGCRIYLVDGNTHYWPPRQWIEEAIRKRRESL
ncbi:MULTISPECIES: DF family (seleno)protein [unclassified Nitrospina]|uniref:DF family (seleno)protein n=1 Tax=unclassified Nitrospina TaxID=2638683 RepID=UPI003F9ABCAD